MAGLTLPGHSAHLRSASPVENGGLHPPPTSGWSGPSPITASHQIPHRRYHVATAAAAQALPLPMLPLLLCLRFGVLLLLLLLPLLLPP